MGNNSHENNKNQLKKLGIIIIATAIILTIKFIAGVDTQSSNNNGTYNTPEIKDFTKDYTEACNYSQNEIPALLNDPNSSEFPNCSSQTIGEHALYKVDDSTKLYKSFVRAKNAFGAMIKNDFYCKIKYETYPNYKINCFVISPTASQEEFKKNLKNIGVNIDNIK